VRAVLQRVRWAEVEVDGRLLGRIERGLLVYVGIGPDDRADHAQWLARKVAELRIFEDDDGKLNRSVRTVGGGVLAIPNFTLMADARKGRRPAFVGAARPEQAEPLYGTFLESLRSAGVAVAGGAFGAHMLIRSAADGPVNIILETRLGNETRTERG
jgi:D-tyrosyl-tRNA(Tyr) deacylase